ncbi:hypothetical protein [Parabacteroides goldsteinii]|uniref:hypothetical protein n=1 Tax=Parabacteroides goldsteinii TaxID=328812 RepID=UPI00272DA3CC|nr:hypothetical protein [Parabacteroides goldsteinii]
MKLLSSFETCGKYGSVKLYINGELPGSISDEDIYDIFYNVLPKVNVKIQDKLMSKDIELLKMFEDEIKELENLFDGKAIYTKQIENKYSDLRSLKFRKWLEVTTRKGIIVIGWRKRVINIDWSRSDIKNTAHDLFPDENVTKGDYYIHAWGINKAKEYIDVLLNG